MRGRALRTPLGRAGFTLLEVVIVMIIVGIIGVVVVPALFRSGSATRVSGAEPVLEVLRAARQTAADSGREVRVTIDPANRRYMAELAGSPGPVGQGTFESVTIAADSPRVAITFSPAGTAFGDSMLVTSDGRPMVVSVNPWTGVPRAYAW